MKTLALFTVAFLPILLVAQQVKMPQNSAIDGVVSSAAGTNADIKLWGDSTDIAAYAVSGDGYQDPLSPHSVDSHRGLTWNAQAPSSLTSTFQQLDKTGGILRVIFVGETAGWNNSFGYTYSGNPEDSGAYTVWNKIATTGPTPTVSFGDHFDVHLGSNHWSQFDLWFSCAGVMGEPPTNKNGLGGIYTLFHNPSAQSLWAQDAVPLETQNGSADPVAVNTYLISFEDWRLNSGADCDYSDLRIALQFYNPDGSAMAVVPEPATTALLLAVAAMMAAFLRIGSPRRVTNDTLPEIS